MFLISGEVVVHLLKEIISLDWTYLNMMHFKSNSKEQYIMFFCGLDFVSTCLGRVISILMSMSNNTM
jgi:hypothetical protein